MKYSALFRAAAFAALAIAACAQTDKSPKRPAIVGVAHIAVRTDNMEAARKFYGQQLGYEEAFQLDRAEDGNKPVCFLSLIHI